MMQKFYKCPKCGAENIHYKWPISDFHDDGTESLSCPNCKHEVHEYSLPSITRCTSEETQ